jgi:Ca2+-binding RTX toxin-like protein
MRGVHVLAGIASAGLVAASLMMGAPASARNVVNGTGGDDDLRGTPFADTIRLFGGNDRVLAWAGPDLIGGGSGFDRVWAGRGN